MAETDFESIWNALPHPAFVVDADDVFAAVNSGAEVWFSTSVRTMIGRDLARVAGKDSRLADLIAQVRKSGASLAQHNVELTRADGAVNLVNLTASPLSNREGAVLVVIQPRSLAEKMDRSLSHRSAARSVMGMSAMLAHEIKNPLAGISGAAQLLAMNLGDEDAELTGLIREEADRIVKLLERVEQFGDNRPTPRQPVNIHDVLDRAHRSARAGFASRVRFVESFDPSLPPTAGDPDQLIQVFLNLIKNAAEAAPDVGGVITLHTSFRPGMTLATPGGRRESLPLQVTVTDNGPGVPDELKSDIFEPFVTSRIDGSGLGLALVSKIVADHGGVIECDSEPGRTTFRLLLPVWTGDGGEAAEAPERDDVRGDPRGEEASK